MIEVDAHFGVPETGVEVKDNEVWDRALAARHLKIPSTLAHNLPTGSNFRLGSSGSNFDLCEMGADGPELSNLSSRVWRSPISSLRSGIGPIPPRRAEIES